MQNDRYSIWLFWIMGFDIIEINLVHILETWAPRYYFSFRETIELSSVAQLSRACFFFVSAHYKIPALWIVDWRIEL